MTQYFTASSLAHLVDYQHSKCFNSSKCINSSKCFNSSIFQHLFAIYPTPTLYNHQRIDSDFKEYFQTSINLDIMKPYLTLLTFMLISIISSRIFQTTMKFSNLGRNKGWIFLDKMSFAPGNITFITETKVSGLPYGASSEVFIQAIPESKWLQQSENKCEERVTRPLAIHPLNLSGKVDRSQSSFSIEQYELYYFVLKDCQSRYLSEYSNNNLNLDISLHLTNNGKEVGEEEDHWYIFPFIIIAGLSLVYYYINQIKQEAADNHGQIDWAKMLLFAGTVTQISSLFWKSLGFIIYTYTGSDYSFFHVIYLLLHSTSESAVCCLILLIGFGWTLSFTTSEDFDLFLPMMGCLAFVNILITVLTKLGHSHDRHHLFDSLSGYLMIGFRVIVILVFLIAIIKTYRQVRHNLKRFLLKFFGIGLIYLSGMPGTILIGNRWISASDRHEFVFITIEIIKFTTNLYLIYMMNHKKSEYNRVNYKNASFIPEGQEKFF